MVFEYGNLLFESNELMCELETESAQLVIGSPPYSLSRKKDPELQREAFLNLMTRVLEDSYRILNDSGIFINISTDERSNGSLWQKSNKISLIAEKTGFKLYDHIIWSRTDVSLFRPPFSQILIFKKGKTVPKCPSEELRRIFLKKIWNIRDTQNRKDRNGFKFTAAIHPSVVEYLILRFTKKSDMVINPFVGSGTIIAVAESLQRKWVGYEIDNNLSPLINDTFRTVESSFTQ